MCNFLWSGSDDTIDMRSRVAWRTIILPHVHGGLGMIGLEMWIRILLLKFIVKGCFLGEKPYKYFLRDVLH